MLGATSLFKLPRLAAMGHYWGGWVEGRFFWAAKIVKTLGLIIGFLLENILQENKEIYTILEFSYLLYNCLTSRNFNLKPS